MDFYGFRDDVVETIARVILHKDEQAKGVTCPNTDNWLELYNGGRKDFEQLKYSDSIQYNRFRSEVDGTTAKILNSLQFRRENIGDS